MDQRVNYCLIGDTNVGKTCLMLKYTQGEFYKTFHSTVGVDFATKLITYEPYRVRLNIWDTAGQEKYHSICRSYYRMCDIVILMFDVTNYESFDHLRRWYNDILEYNSKQLIGIIVGNKTDLYPQVVSQSDIDSLVALTSFEYIDISVKNDDVSVIFDRSLEQYLMKQRMEYNSIPKVITERHTCCW